MKLLCKISEMAKQTNTFGKPHPTVGPSKMIVRPTYAVRQLAMKAEEKPSARHRLQTVWAPFGGYVL